MTHPEAHEITIHGRIRGCLLAGAVGDALGAPVEFLDLATIRSRFGPDGPRDMVAGSHPAGSITDDTQMALFTAEGLIRAQNRGYTKGICNPATVVQHAYWRWLRTQSGRPANEHITDDLLTSWLTEVPELNSRRAPGNTCLTALSSGRHGTPTDPINNSKGCGTVMRVAPVGFVPNWANPFDLGCETGALTHGHPTGWLAAGALAQIIAELANRAHLRDAILIAVQTTEQNPNHHETTNALRDAISLVEEGDPSPDKIARLGQGWIAEEALAISVYCALACPDLESAVRLAVTHSGDSDSTGCITGNLLGTLYGESAIPRRWLDVLELRQVISRIADDLHVAFFDPSECDEHGAYDWQRYPDI